jgi:hypothetical protein
LHYWIKKPSKSNNDPLGTVAMMNQVFSQATEPISFSELVERMLAAGWETKSQIPSNTARTALGRMVDRGTIIRTPENNYRRPTAIEALLNTLDHGDEYEDGDDD